MSDETLSSSALARRLELPVQQVFAALKDHGWIKKLEDGWALTGKGEFEGGSYQTSKRYGRYIVWPVSLLEHPLLKNLEDSRLISAAAIGKSLELSAQQLNRLFAELAWLSASKRGWQLTEAGRALGGQSFDNQQIGLSYVLWPEDIASHPAFQRLLARCCRVEQKGSDSDDLFNDVPPPLTLDGKQVESWPHWHIAQWLYLAGLRYAWQRDLPVEEPLLADFYLADAGVYLEYWASGEHADQLAKRMRRMEVYKNLGAPVLDIHPEDLPYLDEYLSRRLQELSVEFY